MRFKCIIKNTLSKLYYLNLFLRGYFYIKKCVDLIVIQFFFHAHFSKIKYSKIFFNQTTCERAGLNKFQKV